MRPEERAARRLFLRVARVLIGAVILVVFAGGAVWLRASLYPWTDRALPGARMRHAVLHLVNESGAPCALAWRRAAEPGRAGGPWVELPPANPLPDGVVELSGFRLLAPLPGDAVDGTPIELRLTLAGQEQVLAPTIDVDGHLRLRVDASRTLHLHAGRANWLGAPAFETEPSAGVVGTPGASGTTGAAGATGATGASGASGASDGRSPEAR